jgi:hypothetical protein
MAVAAVSWGAAVSERGMEEVSGGLEKDFANRGTENGRILGRLVTG